MRLKRLVFGLLISIFFCAPHVQAQDSAIIDPPTGAQNSADDLWITKDDRPKEKRFCPIVEPLHERLAGLTWSKPKQTDNNITVEIASEHKRLWSCGKEGCTLKSLAYDTYFARARHNDGPHIIYEISIDSVIASLPEVSSRNGVIGSMECVNKYPYTPERPIFETRERFTPSKRSVRAGEELLRIPVRFALQARFKTNWSALGVDHAAGDALYGSVEFSPSSDAPAWCAPKDGEIYCYKRRFGRSLPGIKRFGRGPKQELPGQNSLMILGSSFRGYYVSYTALPDTEPPEIEQTNEDLFHNLGLQLVLRIEKIGKRYLTLHYEITSVDGRVQRFAEQKVKLDDAGGAVIDFLSLHKAITFAANAEDRKSKSVAYSQALADLGPGIIITTGARMRFTWRPPR